MRAAPLLRAGLLMLPAAVVVQAFDAPVVPGHEEGRRVWAGTCIGCHADGLAGAPPVGDPSAWAPRLAKGRSTLLSHALEGHFGPDGSMMPPRGGNEKLSDAEVGAALDYMLALVRRQPLSQPAKETR
jgi:cytochrome c5